MLSFINVSNPSEIQKYVEQFDLKTSTWIVSDLKSKLDIQAHCLKKYDYYLDDSVLRISDFWRLWLRRLSPEISVVSSDFIKVLVQNFMQTDAFKSVQSQFELESHQYTTVYSYLNELAPILLSPQSDEIIQEWMKTKNHRSWFKWYFMARMCLKYLTQEKKVLDQKWIPSFIQNLDLNLIQWTKHIYLDLGSEMTSIEMSLFQQFSQKINVTVFVPNPEWKDKYKFLLNTYATYSGYSKVQSDLKITENEGCDSNVYQRFSTEALEIKFLTYQIRQWIENGVDPQSIGVVSPRLEDYWPVLKMHFDEEGIPYNKKNVASLLSLGCFQKLLSQVKSRSSDVSWESLEQAYYSDDEKNIQLEFEKFKAQFLELTDSQDLLRHEDIRKIFYHRINLNEKMGRLVFLAFLFKIWIEKTDPDLNTYLEMAFKEFLSRTVEMELSLEQWMKIFSMMLAKKEVSLQKVISWGIDVGTSNSSHLRSVQYMIWFGLDEAAFRKGMQTMIPLDDIEELKFKFDFPVPYPEESHAEFNIRWYSQYPFRQQIFTCSLTSSKAEPLNASSLILENNIAPDVNFDVQTQATRIDTLQIAAQSSMDNPQVKSELVEQEVIVQQYRPQELSITDLINYDHCGFKLLAAKGFKLRDYPVLSIDIDPRQRGSISHALFEFLVQNRRYTNYNATEVENFLNLQRSELKLYPQMDDFWGLQKKKLLDLAQKFSTFENERVGSQTVEHLVEQDFKLSLDQLVINGRIDRIDRYPDQSVIVLDYKRSESSATSYGVNWMEKHEFQMLFYLLAAETALGLKDQGAYYFFYKNMRLFKGIIDRAAAEKNEIAQTLQLTKKAQVDSDEYIQLKTDFKNYLFDLEKKLNAGIFTPRPFDVEICGHCDWNKLCRAVHL